MVNFKRINKVIVFWQPFILIIIIFILSSIPANYDTNSSFWVIDLNPKLQNFLHIPLYGLLCFFFARSFSRLDCNIFYSVFWAVLISVFYGGFDEFHQTFVSGRYGSMQDIIFDSIGALAGGFLFILNKKVTL